MDLKSYRNEVSSKSRKEWIERQSCQGPALATRQWDKTGDITKVLSAFCGIDLNHMFMPNSGGLDLNGVGRSHESNCLELHAGSSAHIIRPGQLSFVALPEYPSLSYFRLEALPMLPALPLKNKTQEYEEVVEISAGDYVDRVAWDQGFHDYDENGAPVPLPESARLVTRWLSGVFVIFAKGSLYNHDSTTYDARHSKMSGPEFRKHIQGLAAMAIQEGIPV